MTAKRIAGSGSLPPSLVRASTRTTGTSASRTNPIALGTVHGRHGAPGRVSGGGGPDRSSPDRRRNVRRGGGAPSGGPPLREPPPQLRDRLRGALERHAAVLVGPPPADLRLDRPRLQRAAPERQAQRHAEQFRVGELLARAGVAVVVEDVDAGRAQLLVELLGRRALVAVRLAQADELHVPRRDRPRPGDALLVGGLLDRRRGGARRA